MNDLSVRFAALSPEPSLGDWDDVLRRAGTRRISRRRVVAFAFAVALLFAVATYAAFPGVRDFFFERGLIGLPPEGAAPSVPQRTKLEFAYWVDAPPRMPAPDPWRGRLGRNRVWVYADGTLLWLREVNRPGAGGIDPLGTGFIQQRLTPQGIELLRSEVEAAERLGRSRGPNGAVLAPHRNTPPLDPVTNRLRARLSYPDSWLPASAWKERDTRPYVPSMFAVCSSETAFEVLPEPARVLLRGRSFHRADPVFPAGWCVDVTVDEARSLAATLDAAGLEGGGDRLTYVIRVEGRKEFIAFEPYLPDGTITCSACG